MNKDSHEAQTTSDRLISGCCHNDRVLDLITTALDSKVKAVDDACRTALGSESQTIGPAKLSLQ